MAVLTGDAAVAPIVEIGRTVLNAYTSGDDIIVGAATGDQVFDLSAGGNDTVTGGSGNDGFSFGATFTIADHVDGGAGTNAQIALQGDYSGGLLLTSASVVNVEALAMLPGFNYSITIDDTLVPSGKTFTFWSSSMASANHVTIDGSAELDGTLKFYLGAGNDTATGGAGADTFYAGDGADTLKGNGGADTFGYTAVSNSTGNANGTAYDTILDFAASTDKFSLPGIVTGVDTTVGSGLLRTASFDTDLAAAIGSAQMDVNHAVLFTPGSGDYVGHTFLIVDANGAAGYQSGADFVFDVTGMTGSLAMSDFIT